MEEGALLSLPEAPQVVLTGCVCARQTLQFCKVLVIYLYGSFDTLRAHEKMGAYFLCR